MALADMPKQTAALNESLRGVSHSAHAAGTEMEHLSKSVFSYTKALLAVGTGYVVKQIAIWFWDQRRAQKEIIAHGNERLDQIAGELRHLKAGLTWMRQKGTFTANELKQQQDIINLEEHRMAFIRDELTFRQGLLDLAKKRGVVAVESLFTLGLVHRLFERLLLSTHELNRAFIKTDSSLENRLNLMEQALSVQQELGASTQTTADAAAALVEYGGNLNPAFQQNLKTIVMMREGLGIAAHTGAELVTIFSKQLRTAAETIGNVMAQVAAQTGLSAERAAQFAIEIGRALRLLGPGFRTEAAGVTKIVAGLAGRVQELGGNAQLVVNLYKRMTGGTAEAFFMRGLAGATVGQMGGTAGTEAAMRGLSARISSILTAPQGTAYYAAQLEAVAEITGMAANEVIDFQQAIKDLDKPLNEAKTLAKAYRDQTALVGQSWKQMKEALTALAVKALLPLLDVVQPVIKFFADVVKTIAGWKPMVWVLEIALPVATVAAIFAVKRLATAIWKMAAQSEFAALMLEQKGLPSFRTVGTFFKELPSMLRKGTFGAGGWTLAAPAATAGRMALLGGTAVGWGLPLAALGISLGAGMGIGALLNRYVISEKWSVNLAGTVARWFGAWKESRSTTSLVRSEALSKEHGAINALVEWARGKGTEENFDKLYIRAVAAARQEGVSPEVIAHNVAYTARKLVEGPIWLEMQTRPTVEKTKADLVRDQQLRAQLDILDAVSESLTHQKVVAQATLKTLDELKAAAKQREAEKETRLFEESHPKTVNPYTAIWQTGVERYR